MADADADRRADSGRLPSSPLTAPPMTNPTDSTDPNAVYDNPLIARYAGREMAERWGPRRKFRTWRRLWLALAEA